MLYGREAANVGYFHAWFRHYGYPGAEVLHGMRANQAHIKELAMTASIQAFIFDIYSRSKIDTLGSAFQVRLQATLSVFIPKHGILIYS